MKAIVTCLKCGNEREVSAGNKAAASRRPCRSCAQKGHGRIPPNRSGLHTGTGYVGSDGYYNVSVGSRKYKKAHRLVVEHSINRELEAVEVVHHIDLDKLNNDLDNLLLCANQSEHSAVHSNLDALTGTLIKTGAILYDRTSGSYVAHVKLRELLEHLEAGNQQPSRDGDDSEGSETKSESLVDNNSLTSAGHS